MNKFSGSCNNINDSYAKLCIPNVAKNLNVEVFNLMPKANETRHTEWHETCKCKCRLDASVCNNEQHWHNDKCRCELIDKGIGDKGFVNVNVMNHVTLENIQIMKILNVEKG